MYDNELRLFVGQDSSPTLTINGTSNAKYSKRLPDSNPTPPQQQDDTLSFTLMPRVKTQLVVVKNESEKFVYLFYLSLLPGLSIKMYICMNMI